MLFCRIDRGTQKFFSEILQTGATKRKNGTEKSISAPSRLAVLPEQWSFPTDCARVQRLTLHLASALDYVFDINFTWPMIFARSHPSLATQQPCHSTRGYSKNQFTKPHLCTSSRRSVSFWQSSLDIKLEEGVQDEPWLCLSSCHASLLISK